MRSYSTNAKGNFQLDRVITGWHDTSAWRANHRSYDLVSGVAADMADLPCGTERLLVLAARRPLTSWVPFATYVPSDPLRIAVAFSGDLDSRRPHVYRYVFEAK